VNPQDLQRLIEIIAEELLAAERPGGLPARCSCHAVQSDCCPTRLRGVVDAGASRLGLHATGGAPGVSSMIDHTLLKPDATRAEIEKLCREAAEFGFATVCVNPFWVALAASRLRGTGVGVCSVVGFPLGATTADVKNFETRRAIFDGASEIDMVMNIGALKSGDFEFVRRDIAGVAETCHQLGARLKVILETALLSDAEKVKASELTKLAGADFVKTSTGFAPGGATHDDLRLMRANTSPHIQVKAAGGVRTLDALLEVMALGTTRIGATATKTIIDDFRARKAGQQPVPGGAAPEGGY
jgi:deoxyribose-phosphate aldolase